MPKTEPIKPQDLAHHYFKSLSDKPYMSYEDEMHDWLRFLDMLCAAMLLYKEMDGDEARAFCSCQNDEKEITELVLPIYEAEFACRESFSAVLDSLLMRSEQTQNTGLITPWNMLLEIVQPDLSGLLGILCAFAVSNNRKYEKIFSVLQQQTQIIGLPTVGLAEDMQLLLTDKCIKSSETLENDSLIGSLLWANTPDVPSILCRPLSLHPRIYKFLSGNSAELGALEEYAVLFLPSDDMEMSYGKPSVKYAIAMISKQLDYGCAVLHIHGLDGCGKTFFARSIASELNSELLVLNADLIKKLSYHEQRKITLDAARYCILNSTLLLISHADTVKGETESIKNLLSLICKYLPMVFISSEEEKPDCLSSGIKHHKISVDRPDKHAQLALWTDFSKSVIPPLSPSICIQDVCDRYDLTPKQIKNVLSISSAEAMAREEQTVSMEVLSSAVRVTCRTDLGENATLLTAPFTWDDLKVEPKAANDLKNACNRLRYRGTVNLSYGFDKKLPYGKGISILLYGPPGTGKTMAAQVVANDLGLDLYRIDLSQILSKYIGETQKNLCAIFDSARYSNAILFFDEADALFAKRTDISSSNDRHANTETAFLLQKVEEFSGVTILATNNTQNFDAAFRRRITFQINLMQPDADLRLEIWKSVFPKEAPLQDDIDLERIAQKAELTGSGIKSAAVSAAYAAAVSDGVITTAMVRKAAAEELRKNGRVVEEYELL